MSVSSRSRETFDIFSAVRAPVSLYRKVMMPDCGISVPAGTVMYVPGYDTCSPDVVCGQHCGPSYLVPKLISFMRYAGAIRVSVPEGLR